MSVVTLSRNLDGWSDESDEHRICLPRVVTNNQTGDIGVGNEIFLEPFDRGTIQLDKQSERGRVSQEKQPT